MSTTQRQLLTMHHPSFRAGYQAGRRYSFQEQITLTDLQIIENMQCIFQENAVLSSNESVYYIIGSFIGQMSAVVIPYQPSEDDTQAIRATFLTKLRQGNEASDPVLIKSIQQFWELKDYLAQTLDSDDFEQMLRNGVGEVL